MIVNVCIKFEDAEEQLPVTPLGERRYRLEATPLFLCRLARKHTVVELEPCGQDKYGFIQVLEPAPGHMVHVMVPKRLGLPGRLDPFLQRAESEGADWERLLGGILFLHLPSDSHWDWEDELETTLARYADEPEPSMQELWEAWRRRDADS